MKFDIITIFPKIFDSYFGESILGRARKKGMIEISAHDLRQWTDDKHKTVDDSPYGGGPGMILKVEPIWKAVAELQRFPIFRPPGGLPQDDNFQFPKIKNAKRLIKRRVVLFSAKGKQFTQADARRLAKYDQLILVCGRYEGVDERVAEHIADEELSVGNFVLTGGEIPAMIMVDAVSRLIPGVLGKKASLEDESFSLKLKSGFKGSPKSDFKSYLEYPQFTRPENFRGWKTPKILLSGNHKKIREWRKKMTQKISNF